MYKLLKGDCLELMKDIPDKSIDLILTDPPYLQENHGGGKSNFAQRKLVKMPKQTIGFISNSFDMENTFSEFERICKTTNIIIFCSNKQVSKIMNYWEQKKYSVTLLVWDKTNPVPLGNGKYISNLEFIIYVRGKNATYNNKGYEYQLKTFRYPFPGGKGRYHPTQKPIDLIERLLEIHSNENDTILDCFMGSGTTGVACKELNRNFIGIEIDEKYFEIACERINNTEEKAG